MNGIKIYRERQGVTQGELAQEIGVTARTVRAWESGAAHPGKKLAKVASFLNTTEVDILIASRPKEALNDRSRS